MATGSRHETQKKRTLVWVKLGVKVGVLTRPQRSCEASANVYSNSSIEGGTPNQINGWNLIAVMTGVKHVNAALRQRHVGALPHFSPSHTGFMSGSMCTPYILYPLMSVPQVSLPMRNMT